MTLKVAPQVNLLKTVVLFWEKVSLCRPGGPGTTHVAQAGL